MSTKAPKVPLSHIGDWIDAEIFKNRRPEKKKYKPRSAETLMLAFEKRMMGAARPEEKRKPGRPTGAKNKPKPQGPG
jgi:hypothetical protein